MIGTGRSGYSVLVMSGGERSTRSTSAFSGKFNLEDDAPYLRGRNTTFFLAPTLVYNKTDGEPLALDEIDDDDDSSEQEKPLQRITYAKMLESYPAFRKSPFELITRPYETLPGWAEKQSRHGELSIPRGKHVCFTHVGKAGGSTLGCSLGFQLHCRGTKMRNGTLPLYTTNVMHNSMNDCPRHMPYYLFSLRNPIDRVRSAYLYDRPTSSDSEDAPRRRHHQEELYIECPFWTLNDFAVNGLSQNGTASKRCQERAVNAIRGLERHGYHLFFNYRWFVEETEVFEESTASSSSPSQILAIRTEHMTRDWISAEKVLANDDTDENNARVEKFALRNPSAWKAEDSDYFLSKTALEALCYHLCPEIQMYKKLLLRAVNLQTNDFVVSMKELGQTCPAQVTAVSCPSIET